VEAGRNIDHAVLLSIFFDKGQLVGLAAESTRDAVLPAMLSSTLS
jgi:hypothetical protein